MIYINIIHCLYNAQVRNAYTHALAYRWQLTMQSIREKLEHGELLKVSNASGKAVFWKSFDLITTTNNEPIGHVQCRICKHILAHDSKKTETSHLQWHVGMVWGVFSNLQ